MHRTRFTFVALLLFFACATSPLNAAIIHVTMTAEIQSTDPDGPFAGATGTVSAEAFFPDTGVETESYYIFHDDAGYYSAYEEPYLTRFNLGEPAEYEWYGVDVGVMETTYVGVEVSDNHWEPDRDWFQLTGEYQGILYNMIFIGPADSLTGDDIPDIDTLDSFYTDAAIFVRSVGSTNPFWLEATATHVTFSEMAVPLPASLWLMLSGLAGFSALARKRRKPL